MRMNAIQIAAKLYETRDSMKFLFGDRYQSKVQQNIELLEAVTKKWNCSDVDAISRLSKELNQHGDNGVGLGLLFAAYVEKTETEAGQ